MKKKMLFCLLTLLCSVGTWAGDTRYVGNFMYDVDFNSSTAVVLKMLTDTPRESFEEVIVPEYIQLPYSRDDYDRLYVRAIATDAFKLLEIDRLYLPSTINTLLCDCFNNAYISNIYLKSEHAPALGTDKPDATRVDPTESLGLSNKPNLYVVQKDEFTDEAWTNQFQRVSRIYDNMVDGIALATITNEKGIFKVVVQKEEPYTGDVVIPDNMTIGEDTYDIVAIDEGVFENGAKNLNSLTLGANINEVGKHFLKGVNLKTLVCQSTTPPLSFGGQIEWGEGASIGEILVPYENLSDYRATWSDFADKIFSCRVVIDGIKYEYNPEDNTASVVGCESEAEELTIPKSITYNDEDYTVTSIRAGALTNLKLKRIFLPETLESVEVNCFSGSTIDNIYSYAQKVIAIEGDGIRLGLENRPNLFVKVYPTDIERWDTFPWSSIARRISPVPGVVVDGIAYFLYGPYPQVGQDGTATVVPNEMPYTGDITIPNQVESNGYIFPVTELGELAFADSGNGLKTLTLNSNTKYVQKDCFRDVSLETLTIYSNQPLSRVGYSHDIVWGKYFDVNTIRVPYQHVSEYRTNINFEKFADKIVAIPVVKDGIAYQLDIENHQATVMTNDYTGDIIIPATVECDSYTFNVTEIAERAFYECNELTSITLPNSITTLGRSCFHGCSGLTYMVLPDNIKSLPTRCFYECRNLEYIELPANLERVDAMCFNGCSSLKALTFPASVNYLGTALFSGSGITSMQFVNPAPELDNCISSALLSAYGDYWSGVYNCILHIPAELRDAYATKSGWKEFMAIYGGDACSHYYTSAVWSWKNYEGAPASAYFVCSHCNHRTEAVTADLSDKYILKDPTCTETGKYQIEASATSPNGIRCWTTQEFTIPALHTSIVGHCDICGEEVGDYLAFKAVNGDVTVGLKSNHWNNLIYPLEYSTDRMTWNKMDGTVAIPQGSVAFFRSGYDEVQYEMNLTTFTMTSDNGGLIEASGNIMSLLDKTCTSTFVGASGFYHLFKDCKPLLTAPKLPATSVERYSYNGMFQDCTNLNCDIDLPAIKLFEGTYHNMFLGCSSMSSSIIVRAHQHQENVLDGNNEFIKFFNDWIVGTAGVTVYINMDGHGLIHNELNPKENSNIVKWGVFTEELAQKDDEKDPLFQLGQQIDHRGAEELYVENLTITRPMTNDGWLTICLPFDVKLEDSPFSQAAKFVRRDGDTFKFMSVSELRMGVGYIVQVDNEMPELTFSNVKIPRDITYSGPIDSDFQGTFWPVSIPSSSYVIGTGDTVNPITGDGQLNGFRAYFKNVTEGSDTKTFRFTVDDDDIITSISLPERQYQREAYFNLQGQRVNASHRGIVIKNGRKYVRK